VRVLDLTGDNLILLNDSGSHDDTKVAVRVGAEGITMITGAHSLTLTFDEWRSIVKSEGTKTLPPPSA